MRDWIVGVELRAEMVRSCERHVGQPYAPSRFVALEIRIVCGWVSDGSDAMLNVTYDCRDMSVMS